MDGIQKEYFAALCEYKNVTKAAEALFISRQALSIRMKRMEEEFGTELFIRKKEGIELTEAGLLVQKCIQDEEALWAKCYKDISQIHTNAKEVIRFVMQSIALLPTDFTPIYNFEQMHPNLSVEFINAELPDGLRMMRNGEVDLVRRIYTEEYADLYRVCLAPECAHVVISKKSKLAHLDCIDFMKDMRGQTILYEGQYLPASFRQICQRLRIKLIPIRVERELITDMIANEKGCIYMQASRSEHFLSDSVCAKPVCNFPLNIESYIVYRPDISKNVRNLIHYLYQYYNDGQDIVLPDETK